METFVKDFLAVLDCKEDSIYPINRNKRCTKLGNQVTDYPPNQSFSFSAGIKTVTPNTILKKAVIEAHKYKYGYTRPIRSPTLEQAYNDYIQVKFFGPFLRPPEEAYQPSREYGTIVTFKSLAYDSLVRRGLMPSEDDEESKKWWDEQEVCFLMRQENIVCPEFNVTFPRLNAYASVIDKKGKIHDYKLKMRTVSIYNGTFSQGMRYEQLEQYELYFYYRAEVHHILEYFQNLMQ